MAGGGTQIGNAYVEVVPKVSGDFKSQVTKHLPSGADGGKSGNALMAGMKGAVGAGAVALGNIMANVATDAASKLTDIFVQAFDGFAQYEQLSGGIEKLFGADAAKIVMDNAEQAFKTAGMSANQYMEQATSFSASLIKSLNGDTVTAAQITDQAMRDMSDNVNVFGTDMASVQNAYQGFAKGNFTMLDNLKLGYGGTKEEMEKLLRDAEQMEGFVEGSLSIDSFADILDAIHIVQEHQQIAGTTAKEAASTVEGSINQMKAAWDNWLTALGREDVDMTAVTDQLVQSIETAASNAIPVAGRIIQSMGEALVAYAPVLYDNALVAMSQIAVAAPDATPQVIAALVSLVLQGAQALVSGAPAFAAGALQMLEGIVIGIIQSIPQILVTLVSMIPTLVQGIASGAGQMLGGAMLFFDGITQALVEVAGKLGEMLVYVVTHLPEIIANGAGMMAEAGGAFLDGLLQGFLGGAPALDGAAAQSAKQMADTAAANADGSAVAQNYTDSLLAGFDMSQFELKAADETKAAIDAAALTADATPITKEMLDSATKSLDTTGMNDTATDMVENAVEVASNVDAASVGENFSKSAASGVDMDALADKVAELSSSAPTDIAVNIKADTSGVKQLTAMAQQMSGAYTAAASKASSAVKGISTAASAAAGSISGAASKASASFGSIATKAASASKSVQDVGKSATSASGSFSKISSAASKAFESMASKAKSACDSAKKSINSIPSSKTITVSTAKGTVWYPSYTMPAIKPGETKSASVTWLKMAEGGILTKPVFVAGEAGPEAVLPLSKLSEMLDESNGKYAGDTFNIELNYTADADAEKLALDLARSIRRYRMAGAF